jgi:hypothetical protein
MILVMYYVFLAFEWTYFILKRINEIYALFKKILHLNLVKIDLQ